MMRLYNALLHAYPASFRAEYGADMCAIFARRLHDASNIFAWVALWAGAIADTLWNAFWAHADILRYDLRHSARSLRRSPGFTLTAVTITALGIGATTAAFTMADHVLLRPLPFKDSSRLVRLYEDHSPVGLRNWDLSPANYRDWQGHSTSFESLGAIRGLVVNLVGSGEPRQLTGASMTWQVFPMLGIKPVLGRYFTADDDREGAPAVVVVSYALWMNQFGGDASAVGRNVLLDDQPYQVIGVMPGSFLFPARDAQVWTAMRFAPQDFADRTNCFLDSIGRLKPGVTVEKAESELRQIAASLGQRYPKELAHVNASAILLHDDVSGQTRSMLLALLAAAGCVLLITCTNLTNLLLARAMGRKKELAVRAAIGAGRERLVRQMLTESLMLAGAGGALGIAIAYAALPMLAKLAPIYLPVADVPPIDARVLGFAAGLTCLTGLIFGALPALRISSSRNADGLRDSARSGGGRRERLRGALVIAEVAGSVALLVCCGLLIRALWRVQSVDPGFRADQVLTVRTALPMPKYERTTRREQFYAQVLSQARQLPGVTGAAYVSFLPLTMRGGVQPVEVQGQPADAANRENASVRYVTPGYFATLGIPLVGGRDVAESDTFEGQWVAVVSASFVRRYFPHENPMGRHFNFAFHDRTVVGVVGDVRVRGLERRSEPQVYLSYKQARDGNLVWYAPKDLAVRASGDVTRLVGPLRAIIHHADAELPIASLRTMEDIVSAETTSRTVQAGTLGAFAGIAFLLAAIGIHGLLSFAVSSRTREIGVRLALGATRVEILRMVVLEGATLAAIGIVLGTGLAYAGGLQLRALLAGVQPGDAETFAAAIGLSVLMALGGSLPPALRAVRVDPAIAIRAE